MGVWILTVVCLVALSIAAAAIVRGGRLPVVWRPRDAEETVGGWPGARRTLRGVAVGCCSGVFSGVLVAGLGGRLFMRIAAATSPESAQGAITDADEVVGEITAGGTISLVIFVGLLGGGVMGLLYRLLRPFLPGPAWFAGLVLSVIAVGAFGAAFGFSDPDNTDFTILEPTWLIALMIVVLVVLFGATLGSVHEWLDARLPPLRRWRDAAWYLAVIPYVVTPFVAAFTLPPVLLGAVAPEQTRDLLRSDRFRRVLSTLAAAAAALALLRFIMDVAQIAF